MNTGRYSTTYSVILWFVLTAQVASAAPPTKPTDTATLDFQQLVVRVEPFSLEPFGQEENLKIEAKGRCWYAVEKREPRPNVSKRGGAVFSHQLSADRVRRLNELLEATNWLTVDGAEGPPTHTHPVTIEISLDRAGKSTSVKCIGNRPAPYAALLHELQSIALQERRIYLHDYLQPSVDTAGISAWQDVGREVAALLADNRDGQSPYTIEYDRYLPIARRTLRDFYGQDDPDLLPAVRLAGYFRLNSELEFLHRMAHDRSPHLRREVALALGRIHDEGSLSVLVSMMLQRGSPEVGFELIKWGDQAVPKIAKLVHNSTDDSLERRENTNGEQMIRAYLQYWDKLDRPVEPRVVAAVRQALQSKDPAKSIRTTYHEEFLKRAAEDSKSGEARVSDKIDVLLTENRGREAM